MIGRDVSFSGCRPNIDTVPTLMQSLPRVAFQEPLSSDSGPPLPRTLAAVSRPSRQSDLLSGQFHLARYHQSDCLSERLLQPDADLLMYYDNALMRMVVAWARDRA